MLLYIVPSGHLQARHLSDQSTTQSHDSDERFPRRRQVHAHSNGQKPNTLNGHIGHLKMAEEETARNRARALMQDMQEQFPLH